MKFLQVQVQSHRSSEVVDESWEDCVVGGDVWEGFLEKVGSERGQLALLRDLSIAAQMRAPPQWGVKVKVSGKV